MNEHRTFLEAEALAAVGRAEGEKPMTAAQLEALDLLHLDLRSALRSIEDVVTGPDLESRFADQLDRLRHQLADWRAWVGGQLEDQR